MSGFLEFVRPYLVTLRSRRKLRNRYAFLSSAYYCHGSWEEKGTWYTIASQRNPEFSIGLGETFCFTMRQEGVREKTSGRSGRLKQEQELWLSRPSNICQREAKEEWTYRLSSQGDYRATIANGSRRISRTNVKFRILRARSFLYRKGSSYR